VVRRKETVETLRVYIAEHLLKERLAMFFIWLQMRSVDEKE
jgi:hypothetical protein